MNPSIVFVLAGLVIAFILYGAMGGHLIFLPVFLIIPLGLLRFGRRRRS